MIFEIVLFAVYFGIGVLFRIVYKLFTFIEVKIHSKVFTIISDVFLAFICVASIVVAAFILNNGQILPYMIISTLIGFVLISVFF